MAEIDPATVHSTMLIILGSDLDPDEVSDFLTVQPFRAWSKGERKRRLGNAPDGKPRYFDSYHEEGGWKLQISESMRQLSVVGQLGHWCRFLEKLSGWIGFLRDSDLRAILDCSLFIDTSVDIILESDLVKRLADLEVVVRLSVYPEPGEVRDFYIQASK